MTVGKYDVEFFDAIIQGKDALNDPCTRGVGANIIEYSSNGKEIGRKTFRFDNSYDDIERYLRKVANVKAVYAREDGSILKYICGVYPRGTALVA